MEGSLSFLNEEIQGVASHYTLYSKVPWVHCEGKGGSARQHVNVARIGETAEGSQYPTRRSLPVLQNKHQPLINPRPYDVDSWRLRSRFVEGRLILATIGHRGCSNFIYIGDSKGWKETQERGGRAVGELLCSIP